MSAAAAAPSTPGALSHRQIMKILSGLMLAMFLASLDQTIVSTAIRTIGDDLHGLSVQAWVTTAFLITSTIATPLYGKLSDIYGRKPLYLTAISIFIVGSALCGLATSMYQLAFFRAIQGIGAGGLFSLALAIIGDVIPPRERARYQGYMMATFATSAVLGPVVGGFLAGQSTVLGVTGWRWIFYINVPIGIAALYVVTRNLKLAHFRHDHRIDWWGAVTLVLGLVPLLIVAEQGRTWGWDSGGAWACYIVGVLGLIAFGFIESRMGDEALLPTRLFRNDVFRRGSVQAFVIGVGMFGGMVSIPLYLQVVKGASPTEAGLLLLPMVAGIMGASMVSGYLTSRTGRYKIFPVIGSVLLVVGLLLLSQVGADTALWQADIAMLIFGAGLGLNMQTIVVAVQNAVDPRDMGVATSSSTFFRQVGGTLGAAVFLSILFGAAADNIPSEYAKAAQTPAFQQAAAAHPQDLQHLQAGLSGGGLDDTSFLQHIDSTLAHPFLVGFSNAIDVVFLVGACVLVLAIALAATMREVPLRTMSAQQARAEAEAAEQAALEAAEGEDAGRATHRSDVPAPT
jgi:EmrB/QacA subfamily drug resistance transporter